MKRLAWCALLPLVAIAAARDDYARQWPLTVSGDGAGAYRVTLDREVYRTARLPSLRDVDVVNADGQRVPAALFAAEQPLARSPRFVVLPWFPLPAGTAAQVQDISVISERDADGSVRRVETRLAGQPRIAVPTSAWLIDASRMHDPIVALELAWPADGPALDTTYRVDGSDDLREWHVLQPGAQLLDLTRDGKHLQQRRIPLQDNARYLRLAPVGSAAAPALIAVRAELAQVTADLPWSWESLQGHAQDAPGGATTYTYEVSGRFPMERADVVLPGNASEWTLQSRDRDDAAWQTRAGPWMAYQVGATSTDRSAAQPLAGVIRDRYWRLVPRTPVNAVPGLRLGYRPEVMVFIAQGRGPYALVAGSARAVRADAPLPQLIDALRARHGSDWQPAGAALGPATTLAGDAALTPAPVQHDWKAWLLWTILVGGALVVAGFALNLLRQPAAR